MSLISETRDEQTVEELVLMLSTQEMDRPVDRRPQITEVINVPTSEHVAQIVGKSGSKIKNLRARTQTCIKTPLRGDDPFFVVTGTPENVAVAAQAIRGASDHFTKLMNEKSNACAVGEVTIQVPVPQQYVGVVVGRNGMVIMKIKEQTNTRINTPKGDSIHPCFEVTGSRANVVAAKEAIYDKVNSAYELKDSTVYDPDLTHKSQYLSENHVKPSQTAPLPLNSPLRLSPISGLKSQPIANSLNIVGEAFNRWPSPSSQDLIDSTVWSWDSFNNVTNSFPKYNF